MKSELLILQKDVQKNVTWKRIFKMEISKKSKNPIRKQNT